MNPSENEANNPLHPARNDVLWEIGSASLLYIFVVYAILPIIHLFVNLGYLQPVSLIIFGVVVWQIVRFVFLEEKSQNYGRNRLYAILTLILVGFFIFNNMLAIIVDVKRNNLGALPLEFSTIFFTILYYIIIYKFRPVSGVNERCNKIRSIWKAEPATDFFKRQILGLILVLWLQFSILLLVIPMPVYTQIHNDTGSVDQTFGIWTYGSPLDDDRIGKSTYIDNDTIQILGDKNIYLVYRIHANNLGDDLVHRLTRCKDRGVEVHLAVTPQGEWNNFVNTWTFADMRSDVVEILKFLNDTKFMGNTITKLVYDMETLPWAFFPVYGFNKTIQSEVSNYYDVQKQFQDFNDEVRENYSIPIRICSDLFQGFDNLDGDDDISSLWGLLYDNHETTTWSYMIYRRDNLGPNYLIDNCRYLNNGDTVILNVWKYDGYFCWEDLDCAVKEARSVITYNQNGKHLNMEVWALYYFLKSYGQEGLLSFIDRLTSDPTTWDPITIRNRWPYSMYSDAIFFGVSWLDYFAPFFRLIYGII